MAGVQVVTGFIPLDDHPRPPQEYFKLAGELFNPLYESGQLKIPAAVVVQDLDMCWLYQWMKWKGPDFQCTHSTADNPQKNTAAYHIVQHEKIGWLVDAAVRDPTPDVFVWIDFGIMHVPGVTGAVIADYIRRAEKEQAIAIPGCWDRPAVIDDMNPCWRFCGGTLICPRKYLMELDLAMKGEAMRHISATRNLSWEVNTLARVERNCDLPIWWYKADHNETMFTAYPESTHA